MITRSIAKDDWKTFFDDFSKHIQSERLELDVMALDLGDQIAEDFVALNGVSYDPKEDTIYIFTAPMRHYIVHPEQIWIVENKGRIRSIEVEDADGVKHQVVMRAAVGGEVHADPQMRFDDLEAIP